MKRMSMWKRTAAFLMAAAMLSDTVTPLAETTSVKEQQEEALRLELAAYSGSYPEGGFAFYESGSTVSEGDEDKEILLVRLGDAGSEASVDIKCLDVTAKYGEDYRVYLEENGEKTELMTEADGQTAAEAAIAESAEEPDDGTYEPSEEISEEEASEEKEDTEESGEEAAKESTAGMSLADSYELQTGEEAVRVNWRNEYEEYQAKSASIEAENEMINSFDGAQATVVFAPGEYKKTVTIHIEDDAVAETEESAVLLLGNASVGMIGEQGQYEIKIQDNEPEEAIIFAMKDAEVVVDDDTAYAAVTIERKSGLGYYASAAYQTVSGTAEVNVAYLPADGGRVAFAPGETEKTVHITLLGGAEAGTSFSVKLDENYVNAAEGQESATVSIRAAEDGQPETSEDAPQTAANAAASGDASADSEVDAVGAETVSGVTYDTREKSVNVRAYTYSKVLLNQTAQASVKDSADAYGATRVTFTTRLSGNTKTIWRYYGKNGTVSIGPSKGGNSVYHSVSDKKENATKTFTDTCNVSYAASQDGTLTTKANTDGLCREAEYTLTKVKYYYPRYTLTLSASDAAQKLKGKIWSSKSKYTEYDVSAITGNSSWTTRSVARGKSATLHPGTLTNGVAISGYELYVGSAKIGTVGAGGEITYQTLDGYRKSYDNLLRQNNYKIRVKPVYKTTAATVEFSSQEASVVGFGDGFSVGDKLNCSMIDRVTFTATANTAQEFKIASVKQEKLVGSTSKSSVGKSNRSLIASYSPSASQTSEFKKTVDINNSQECLTVYYKSPSLTVAYHESETSSSNRVAGEVFLTAYNDPNTVIGSSNYQTPFTTDALGMSMFTSRYLLRSVMDENYLHYQTQGPNGETLSMSTKTIWTYRDEKDGGRKKSVYGNAFVFQPWYADEKVSYHYKAVQDDVSPVGVSGTVYIEEIPLFSGMTKAEKTPAVGVDVNIGGYNAKTDNKGSYKIGSYFNKGEAVGAYISYDTLYQADIVAMSEKKVQDFTLNVGESDKITINSSIMTRPYNTGKKDMNNAYIVEDKEVSTLTLEDNVYTLKINASGSAGITPGKAEFYFYDKNGNKKEDMTQTAEFDGNDLTIQINPMNLSGDGGSLAVGDAMTVKIFDTNGNGYFEHHTSVIVAEKLSGMYTFNYEGVKQESDNAFVQALGSISIAYDFVLDALASDAGTYADEDGITHQLMCIGFGSGFSSAEDVYNTEQQTIKELEQANTVGITPQKKDSMSFTGNGNWAVNLQIGIIMDSQLETSGDKKGQYKFSDYLLIGTVSADYKKSWDVAVGPVQLTFSLAFKAGDMQNGETTGIKWHFYDDPETPHYIAQDNIFNVLECDDISNQGDININVSVTGAIAASVLKNLVGVKGGLTVTFKNHFAHEDNKIDENGNDSGWTNSGAIFLKPDVRLIVLSIPIPVWSQTWRWDYNTADANTLNEAVELACADAEMLYVSTGEREEADYSYMDGRSDWNAVSADKEALVKLASSLEEGVSEVILQDGFYDDSKLTIQDLGGGRYLAAFLNGVDGRDDANRIGAYYTVYDGSEWSEPELLEDDGTADELPVICNAGSKGYLIAWSDAGEKLADMTEQEDGSYNNITDNLNKFDLTGCFYDPDSDAMSPSSAITKTTEADNVSDTNPHVAYDQAGDGTETLKVFYTKSEYSVSSEEEGETVGDLLNPYELIAVRSFDFERDEWSESYSDALKQQIIEQVGDENYSEYLQNWYGQEFLDLAPSVEVTEELTQDGFWKDGTTAQVTENAADDAVAKGGDAIAYNHLILHAYALDKGGMAQTTDDQNLYLQIYNINDEEYHHPIQITSKNSEISDIQFVRTSVPDGSGGTTEVTMLYWLEDGKVKRINISNLVANCLIKGTTSDGTEYYYVNKTRVDDSDLGYEPEQIVAASIPDEALEEEEGSAAITNYRVKENGEYTYVVWTELTPVDDGDETRMESQFYASRENRMTGDASAAVQLTEKKDQFIKDFDVAVDADGNLDVLAVRQTLDTEGNADPETTALVSFKITPSDKVEITNETFGEPETDEEGNLSIAVAADIKNNSLTGQEDITIELLNEDEEVVYSSNTPSKTYAFTETVNEDGTISFTDEQEVEGETEVLNLRGGQTYNLNALLPLNEDYTYKGKLVVRKGDTVLAEKELSGATSAVLSSTDFTAEITERNHVTLSGTITNDSVLESGAYQVEFGYLKEDGTKVSLGSKDMESLAALDIAEVEFEAEVDFDEDFLSQEGEDGSLTDSLEFYMDLNTRDYVTVYHTLNLTASADEMNLMRSLKDVTAKTAMLNEESELEAVDQLEIGDVAGLELVSDGKLACDVDELTNRTEIIWNPVSDSVAKVTENGTVTAVGAGTTEVTGIVVPADTETVMYEDGAVVSVNRYDTLPAEAAVSVKATITVKKKSQQGSQQPDPGQSDSQPTQPEPGTEQPTQEETKVKVGTVFKDKKGFSYVVTSTKAGSFEVSCQKYTGSAKKVTIPATYKKDGNTYKVTAISPNAFKNKKKVTSITLGNNVKIIGANAFYKCKALTKVTIPKNVTTIGKKAFYGCSKLKKVTVKSTKLKSVGSKAFTGIAKKAVIKVPSKKYKTYKKLFSKKAGIKSTMKVTK